jgi:hypothetical protein
MSTVLRVERPPEVEAFFQKLAALQPRPLNEVAQDLIRALETMDWEKATSILYHNRNEVVENAWIDSTAETILRYAMALTVQYANPGKVYRLLTPGEIAAESIAKRSWEMTKSVYKYAVNQPAVLSDSRGTPTYRDMLFDFAASHEVWWTGDEQREERLPWGHEDDVIRAFLNMASHGSIYPTLPNQYQELIARAMVYARMFNEIREHRITRALPMIRNLIITEGQVYKLSWAKKFFDPTRRKDKTILADAKWMAGQGRPELPLCWRHIATCFQTLMETP